MGSENEPLALVLDFENIKVRLSKYLDSLPQSKAEALKARLNGKELATSLLSAAARHGSPRQRWAVADWDRPFFEGDQKSVKTAGYWTDIAGSDKSNSSDHVVVERIHALLRDHPEIDTFVIGTGDGDFNEAVSTLKKMGKHVILWAERSSINAVYGNYLAGHDKIIVEWLEDLLLGDALELAASIDFSNR